MGIVNLAEQLREAMRYWGTGVAIVSSAFDGDKHGMTVNSFTSLSLEPALVMVSLEIGTRTHGLVEKSGVFGVSVLNQDQQELSNRFAGRESELLDRFIGYEIYALSTGAPLLSQGMAQIDCKVVAKHEAGTHTVFIGEMLAMRVAEDVEDQSPLWYYNRDYRKMNK